MSVECTSALNAFLFLQKLDEFGFRLTRLHLSQCYLLEIRETCTTLFARSSQSNYRGQAQALVNLLTIRISRENHQHAGR